MWVPWLLPWLWYLQVWSAHRSWIPTPWYRRKSRPSFANALAALRRTPWIQPTTTMWSPSPLTPKYPDELIDVLATAA